MTEQNAQNFSRIIRLIQRLIDLKEPGYIDHTERMAQAAEYLAKKIGMDNKAIQYLLLAVYIHEVGIFALPDRLIETNESELSENDKILLHQQALIGARLIEQEDGCVEVANIIRHMNENVDGTGIPDGLIDDQIPIESKILLIVDTFNSLIYKKKNLLDIKHALKYMDLNKGSLFDDQLVSLLYDYVRDENLMDDMPEEVAISLSELKPGMVLSRELVSSSGVLLAPRETKVSAESIKMIAKFNSRDPILGSIYITV
ncbi:HD domain-containing protein [candidate division KSB1 bacterium]|nr:HD domain-containing protein [candidate division KSB1 bacterium]